ncbi:hypothetical protein J437_LFUL014794 [Ladona fulva]|uniref:Uncharacterized protein n=1 Tax=Ladona fulva TaxID=123851 RepID=A0A8K0KGZ6_LADFU|nr:hypothetical protein J437_LFUL014794 [Ladona fulva]
MKTGTLVGQFADTVQNNIDNFLSNGVMSTSIVIGSVFLSCDQLFRVEQLTHSDYIPTTVGSKSTNTALGTCFPAPVSLKKVLKLSSPPPTVLSEGICPSGWIPCSKQ